MKFQEADIKKIIKDLASAYGDSNESQGKMIQLLRGLAFSDDDLANKFMVELDKATTEISNKLIKDESIIVKEDFRIPGTDIILEAGDTIKIINEDATEKVKSEYTKAKKEYPSASENEILKLVKQKTGSDPKFIKQALNIKEADSVDVEKIIKDLADAYGSY